MISLPILQPSLNFYRNVSSIALIPIMTSNTTPSGIVNGDGWTYTILPASYHGYSPTDSYYTFDQIDSTALETLQTAYVTYQFSSPKIVTRLYIMSYGHYGGNVTFQGSNDGINYYNIGNTPYTLNVSIDDTFGNTTAYSYYKFTMTAVGNSSGFRTIQLYGY